jgi:hypothetical protein
MCSSVTVSTHRWFRGRRRPALPLGRAQRGVRAGDPRVHPDPAAQRPELLNRRGRHRQPLQQLRIGAGLDVIVQRLERHAALARTRRAIASAARAACRSAARWQVSASPWPRSSPLSVLRAAPAAWPPALSKRRLKRLLYHCLREMSRTREVRFILPS